jgi:5-formyltetrahydrofolate cyclo-ligase
MTKQQLREKVWKDLESHRVARFPGARGRIPNFIGAERCAQQVEKVDAWQKAKVIKANPDSPQRALRHLALKQGKTIYMAVPRLREEKCFVELNPAKLGRNIYAASSIKGAFQFGRQVAVAEMRPVDLIVCGSVAVSRNGMRVGKGGGFSDLEYALALELGIIQPATPILTSVHPLQIVTRRAPRLPHDIPVDFIVTPDSVIRTRTRLSRPEGIYPEYLDEEKISEIPLLRKLKPGKKRR